MTKTGNIFGDDPSKSRFANFVKVYMPYCSSDIHQGHNGPSPETGEFIFNGQTIMIEMLERLKNFHSLSKAKRVILNGSSSGGKGTAGNCNLMGDFLKNLNPEIDFKCIADAAGWIPLPVFNTEECDNGEDGLVLAKNT